MSRPPETARSLPTGAVLVAGAGPGVSGHLARLLAAEGHDLALLGMDPDELEKLAADGRDAGVRVETAQVDLTDDAAVRPTVAQLGLRLGRFALVHFNPSAFREEDPLTLTPAGLAEDVALGVGALLSVVQAARPFLAVDARVSVTGSMAADRPWNKAASLGVQKAAVRNLVHSLDTTLEPHGVRAVSVTVRGTLSTDADSPFSHAAVARALRAALDQPVDAWRSEVPYEG